MPEENQDQITIRCARYGTEATFASEQEAEQAGWRYEDVENDPEWYSPEALENGGFCSSCHRYIDFDHDDWVSDIDGDDQCYHDDCARDEGAFYCDRCEAYHWYDNTNSHYVRIYRDGGYVGEETWCDECVDSDADWNEDDEVYECYINTGRRREDSTYKPLPDGIKPETCQACMAEGNYHKGTCEKCLKNQAFNKKLKETTTWVYDDYWAPSGYYHPDRHRDFKTMFLRLEDEHPYLYYGMEVEVGFEIRNMSPNLREVAKEFIRIVKGRAVAESDSSIGNGIEFIFRPMSYRYWTHPETVKDLREGFQYLKSVGAFLNQPSTNGIHIHMSRKFFENNTEKKPAEINRDLDWVFQYFQPEIEEISGRRYTQYCWSKIDRTKRMMNGSALQMNQIAEFGNSFEVNGTLEKSYVVQNTNHENHHAAVCQTNSTFEVRTFNSTIDVDRILAYLEFTRNIAHTVRNKELKKMSMKEILASKDSPYLDKYVWKLEKSGKSFDRAGAEKLKYKLTAADLTNNEYSPF